MAFYQVEVENVDALQEELEWAGALIHYQPGTRDEGVRDFQVEDPDGNRICFFEQFWPANSVLA